MCVCVIIQLRSRYLLPDCPWKCYPGPQIRSPIVPLLQRPLSNQNNHWKDVVKVLESLDIVNPCQIQYSFKQVCCSFSLRSKWLTLRDPGTLGAVCSRIFNFGIETRTPHKMRQNSNSLRILKIIWSLRILNMVSTPLPLKKGYLWMFLTPSPTKI